MFINHHKSASTGAALVLTVGMLALLTLLAVAFVTLTRTEEKMSRSSIYRCQARAIASAGLHYAIAILQKDLHDDKAATTLTDPQMLDSFDEEWSTLFLGADIQLSTYDARISRWIYIRKTTDPDSPIVGRFSILIQDEASKININTAGIGHQNEGCSTHEIDLGDIPGIGVALRDDIVNYRNGANTVPGSNGSGLTLYLADDNNNTTPLKKNNIDDDADTATEGIDSLDSDEGQDNGDPSEFDPEFPYGDDRPFTDIEELEAIPGIGNNIVKAAKNYATIWSYDLNQYWSKETQSWNKKINLNHFLSTGQLYGLDLTATSKLHRLAANIIDYSDCDIYPTFTTSDKDNPISSNSYLGIEGLQFNEIMTQTAAIIRENNAHHVNRTSAWHPRSTDVAYDEADEGQVGTWSWPWDNANYNVTIQIEASTTETTAPISYVIEGVSGTIDPPATSSGPIPITITGGEINLTLTAAQDPTTPPQKSSFDKIKISGLGKYIEIINISQQGISFDTGDDDAWRLFFNPSLVSPVDDGLPTKVVGDSYLSLASALHPSTSITLNGIDENVPTHDPPNYDYLIIADSLYALDALHGSSDDGSWSKTESEPGKVLVLPDLLSHLLEGTDLVLTDWKNNVIAYAPSSNEKFNITAYDTSSTTSYASFSRISAVNQQNAWLITTSTSPGTKNFNAINSDSGTDNLFWKVKDRSFANLGELGDVFLGTSNNATHDIETSYSPLYFSRITLSSKRIEAEDADMPLPWNAQEISFENDGTTRYLAPGTSGGWIWNWTFNPTNTLPDIDKPFRLPVNNTTFDLLVYGQFLYHFDSPMGIHRNPKPNHGVSLPSVTISGNNINFPIYANGLAPKLDYIILTPEPYTWGKININTASRQTLKALPGISTSLANHILAYRQGNSGPFNQIQEVTEVSNIGETTFKPISNLITVRSDTFRILVKGQQVMDMNEDNTIDSNEIMSTITLDAIIDRNPSGQRPNTNDQYQIKSLKHEYS